MPEQPLLAPDAAPESRQAPVASYDSVAWDNDRYRVPAVGAAHGPEPHPFAGTIDEVTIFDSTVSLAAIQQAFLQ